MSASGKNPILSFAIERLHFLLGVSGRTAFGEACLAADAGAYPLLCGFSSPPGHGQAVVESQEVPEVLAHRVAQRRQLHSSGFQKINYYTFPALQLGDSEETVWSSLSSLSVLSQACSTWHPIPGQIWLCICKLRGDQHAA